MRLLLLALLLAACGPRPSDASAQPGVLAGAVVSVDLSPMAYDGNAVIGVRTDDGRTVAVQIPARTNLCQAEGLGAVGDVAVGDRVEVVGTVGPEGGVTPCTEAGHVFRVVERADPQRTTVRGVVEVGFERSAFHPCDRPDETWWIVPDDAFSAQLDAIRQQHVTNPGRGTRVVVEATVVGTLGPEPDVGYLGYDHRLTVSETRDMAFLAVDPETLPSCR